MVLSKQVEASKNTKAKKEKQVIAMLWLGLKEGYLRLNDSHPGKLLLWQGSLQEGSYPGDVIIQFI